MSIGEVAAEVASAANDVGNVAVRAMGVSHNCEEAAADVTRLTHTTTAQEPPAAIGAWESGAEHARRAAELLRAGNDSLAAYLKAIGTGASNPLVEPIKYGTDLLKETADGGSAFHRARREVAGNVTDVGDRVSKVIKLHHSLAKGPSGARPETRAQPSVGQAHQDFPVADAFSSIVVAAVIVPQAIHWAVSRLWRRIRNG